MPFTVLQLLVIASAFAGLSVAAYIHYKKKLHEPLVCPIGHSCDPVVHSRYSKLFDVPVELIGLVYYTAIVLSYSVFYFFPSSATPHAILPLLATSAIAFAFSVYLTFIQLFVLRELCTWCLISAALSSVIFLLSLKIASVTLGGLPLLVR